MIAIRIQEITSTRSDSEVVSYSVVSSTVVTVGTVVDCEVVVRALPKLSEMKPAAKPIERAISLREALLRNYMRYATEEILEAMKSEALMAPASVLIWTN